ncbi:MAG TPA: GNAT family N-acetyltransferase [Gemmatimonadaceae bacterium]|nr:GNAT family N-acetyltransferase [Gemmatimonadaceae bacterium]
MTRTSVTVRRAVHSDAPALARLRYALRAGLATPDEDANAFLARCEDWMIDRLRPGASWRCWVAERGAVVVGAIWMQIVEKIPNPLGEGEWHGYISNFFVDARARGEGVGSALLTALVCAPETQGLDALFLWPTDRSRTLYHRFGFVGTGGVIERRPASGPPRR